MKPTTKEAIQDMEIYLDLQAKKSAIDAKMKARKESLMRYAEDHEKDFQEDNRLYLGEVGYLHKGKKTVVIPSKTKFDLLKFVRKFPELLKREFKVSAIQEIMKDKAGELKMKAQGISLKDLPNITIVAAKQPVEDLSEES